MGEKSKQLTLRVNFINTSVFLYIFSGRICPQEISCRLQFNIQMRVSYSRGNGDGVEEAISARSTSLVLPPEGSPEIIV